MTKHQRDTDARHEAIAWFRTNVPEGSTVFTILRHVSSSGMTRHIGLVVIKGNDVIYHPNHSASTILRLRQNKDKDGVIVGGCGMDMGFHLVYELASAVYGDGYKLNHRWL